KRICVQTLKYPKLVDDLVYMISRIKERTNIPVSACLNPLDKKSLKRLKVAGLGGVGVGLDCASEKIFKKMKPSFKWNDYIKFLNDVTDVFGSGSAHLIAGLGETDEEIIKMFQKIVDINCYPALFAFTPVKGINIDYPQPGIERYRAIQLARYLIVNNMARYEDMVFENGKLSSINILSSVLEDVLKNGKPFQTSGCPDCNRPFYNEKPGGIMYNYPYPLKKDEMKNVKDELKRYLRI
ncbi:MAG: radical SAM protein, partial [Candidatus Thermoplasmatota archaeon]|nr:radical SAM protein [Candidatus Thermoplasmatota archaeon]